MSPTGWLQDLGLGFRSLRTRPAASITVVATVALAIGATTAVFTVVNGVLLAPLPYPQPERLARLWQVRSDWLESPNSMLRAFASRFPLSVPTFNDWVEADIGLVALGAWADRAWVRPTGDSVEIVRGQAATSGLFEALRVEPALGRTLLPRDDEMGAPRVAVLAHGLWRDLFGGAGDVLDRDITLDGVAHRIVGVMPEHFQPPSSTARLWAPLTDEEKARERTSQFLGVVGRLAPGVSLEEASGRLVSVQERLGREYPDAQEGVGSRAESLLDATVGDVRSTLWLLLGAVALVLVIACVNIANLLSVTGVSRHRELAVRAAMGAGTGRLARGLMVEIAVLASIGGLAGIGLTAVATPMLLRLVPSSVPRVEAISVDGAVLLFGVAVTALTALLVGTLPAFHASRTQPAEVLRAGGRGAAGDRSGNRMRAGLVVTEVALAFALLVSAGLLTASFVQLWTAERGFSTEGLLVMSVEPDPATYPEPEDRGRFLTELWRELSAIPGVDVTATNQVPLSGSSSTTTYYIERPGHPDEESSVLISVVLENYFGVMTIPIREGRGFSEADDAAAPSVGIVNRAMAERFWPEESPIGKRLRSSPESPWTTVVGVVGDVRHAGLDTESEANLYVPAVQDRRYPEDWVLRARGDLSSVLDLARAAVARVSPATPVRGTQVLEERIASSVAVPRFRTFFVVGLGVMAGALALLGVFNVVALSVTQRTREIGVRMALGASSRSVIGAVVGSGLRLAAGGVVLGLALTLAAVRLVRDFLYQVEPTDPLVYTAIALLVLAVSAAASFLPARRAAAIDPVAVLAGD